MSLFGPNVTKLKGRGDTSGLIRLLSHTSADIRVQTARALADLRCTGGLETALESRDRSVRAEAIAGLASLHSTEAIGLLFKLLLCEEDDRLWAEAFAGLERSESSVDPWLSAGVKLAVSGRVERAMRCLDKVAELNPVPEQLGLISGRLINEAPGVALRYLDRYLAITSDDAVAWAGKGWCLVQLGRMDDALECTNRAMELDPKYSWAREITAAIYLSRREYDRVCVMQAATLQVDPGFFRGYITLSEALIGLGRLKDAVESLQCAMEVLKKQDWQKPEDAEALHSQLGMLYAMKGERELAHLHFKEARAAVPRPQTIVTEQSYQLLDILDLALAGTPEERRGRLKVLTDMRLGAHYSGMYDKIVAEGSVEDCVSYDWLSQDPIKCTTAILRFWSIAKVQQLLGVFTDSGEEEFRSTAGKAMLQAATVADHVK